MQELDGWAMDVRQLGYFLAIAEAGSFSAAGARLRISQSALSRQVLLLERELGAPLFERYARGVHLTETGRLLQARAAPLLRQLDSLRSEITDRREIPTGEFHVGIPRSMRALLSQPVLARFLAAYPTVFLGYVEDTSALVRDRLLRGALDLGLLSSHEPAPTLDCRPFFREQMYLVGPVSAGLRPEAPVELAALDGLPLFAVSRPASLRTALESAAAAARMSLCIRAELNSTVMLDLVAAGAGHAVYSYCGLHQHLMAGTVSAAPIRGLHIEWILATARDRPLTLANRLFQRMLHAELAQRIGTGDWPSAELLGTPPDPP